MIWPMETAYSPGRTGASSSGSTWTERYIRQVQQSFDGLRFDGYFFDGYVFDGLLFRRFLLFRRSRFDGLLFDGYILVVTFWR